MATIDFKKVGSLVDITATGYTPRLINAKRDDFELTYSADGSKVSIYAKGVQYPPVAVTDVSVNGSAATDMDDLKSKLATVFSEEGGGSGETPGLNAVLDAGDNVLDAAEAEMAWFTKLANRLRIEMLDTLTDEYAKIEPGMLAIGNTQNDVARIKATNVEGIEDYEIPPGGGMFVTSAVMPKLYIAALVQTGTSAPVATIIKDDFGDVTYSYNAAGEFSAVSAGSQFTVGKTETWVTNNYMVADGFYINTTPIDASTVAIESGKHGDVPANDIIGNVQTNSAAIIINVFHITVYP